MQRVRKFSTSSSADDFICAKQSYPVSTAERSPWESERILLVDYFWQPALIRGRFFFVKKVPLAVIHHLSVIPIFILKLQ
jgi:hypothetical protein